MKNLIYVDASVPSIQFGGKCAGIGIVSFVGGDKRSWSKEVEVDDINSLEAKAILLGMITAFIKYPEAMDEEVHVFCDSSNVVDGLNGINRQGFDVEFLKIFNGIKELCKDLHIHHARRHTLGGVKEIDEADFLAKLAAGNQKATINNIKTPAKKKKERTKFNIRLINKEGLLIESKIDATSIKDALNQVSAIISKDIVEMTIKL